MYRIQTILSMLLICFPAGSREPAPVETAVAKKSMPFNVILILADDLGYAEPGCYGNSFNETPHIDSLAAGGARFTRFYAAAPVCSPYRAALLTGQYPARTGITDYLRPNDSMHLDERNITLAEMFRDNGYHTGIVGKWHLSGYLKAGAPVESPPGRHGFDEALVTENRGIGEGSYFHPYHFNREIAKKLLGDREYLTDRQNQEAVSFIERNKDRPFFLYLSHYAVHTSLHGKPELVNRFREKAGAGSSVPSPKNQANDPYTKWPADYRAAHNNPHLAAQLFSIDEGVGMIMEKLRSLQLDRRTLVIFTSDNGGELNVTRNNPLRGGKSMLYEGGVRVPFIIWAPQLVKAGATIAEPFCNYDLYPTLARLTGLRSSGQPLDGISFAALLKSPAASLRERSLYWHYPLSRPHFLGGRSAGSICRGKWKLIEFFDDGSQELYNLEEDLSEAHNLAGVYPKKVRELQEDMKQWRKRVLP